MKTSNTLMLLGVLCTLILECKLSSTAEPDSSTTSIVSSGSDTTTASSHTEADAKADNNKKTSPNINSTEKPPSAEAYPSTTSSNKVGNPEKNPTTPLSYEQWKEENEKRLNEKYDDKRREDRDRDNNDLLRNIQSALARPDLTAAKKAELDFVSNLLKKAALANDPIVKKAAHDEALGVLTSVLSP
uniref:Uncharacterized protein n=1 Tax=Zeugodacus cucurbitae TaxID=28588 RepID=A0A0A1XIR4_ZEUCU